MSKKSKPKWLPIEQRGSSKDFPLMPALLTLYKIVTSKAPTKATGVRADSFLIDFSLKGCRNYVQEDKWKRFCNQCYQKVRKNPKVQKNFVWEFKKKVPKFLGFCQKVYKVYKEWKNG